MDTNLVPVTADLIRDLRMSGRRREAHQMLRAWRRDVEANKAQVAREIKNRSYRVKAFLKKTYTVVTE